MHKTVFWFLLIWTVFSLVLHSFGYQILEAVMIVLVIDLIALGMIVEIGRKKPLGEINKRITSKIENIESVCQSILNSSNENPIMGKIEARINKQKENVNYLLDKMSKKTLKLEERINKFGVNLAEHVEDFDSRLEKLEKPKETFPIGETVYIEEEKT